MCVCVCVCTETVYQLHLYAIFLMCIYYYISVCIGSDSLLFHRGVRTLWMDPYCL